MPNIFARWCSSVRCVVAGVELYPALLSYSPHSPPFIPFLVGTMVFGATFNHIMFIYMWTHIYSFFSFNVSIYMCITSKLNWYLYVVAGFDHLSQCLEFLICGWNTFLAWSVDFVYLSFRCFILPVCKDAFIPLNSGNHTCERAAWRHLSSKSQNSLGLCLKTQYIYFFLNSEFRITGWGSPHPVPVCVA